MTTTASSSFYNDKRTYGCSDDYECGPVWKYGVEEWCNMEGRYVFIVADLSHVKTPYTMSVCTIAIFGSGYRREEPLPTSLELTEGETMTLTVPHINTEYDTGVRHVIQLRQPEDKIIDFVSFEESSSSSNV